MNGCFHWRRHKRSPYQHFGLHWFHCKCWVTRCDSQFLLQELENFRQVMMIRDGHVLQLWLCVHRPHKLPHWHSPDWPDTPNSAKSFSRSSGCVQPNLVVSLGFGFAIGAPSLEVASWPLFDMALCFPTWSSEENHWIGCQTTNSSETLWVLDTFLIVGLLTSMIILMTASLSPKIVQLRLTLRRMCVSGYVIHLTQVLNMLVSWFWDWVGWALLLVESNTSITMSHISRASNPSMRKPASREIISDSVELCETEVCFLHIQLMVTNVRLPKIHRTPPEVDFEPSRSLAKSESWNNPILHWCAVFPTWQYCVN